MPRRWAFLGATCGCATPMTAWATRRMARLAGAAGRPTTNGTPSFTDRIISIS